MFEIGSVAGGGSGVLDGLTAAVDELQKVDPRDAALVDTVADIAVLHAQIQRLQSVMLGMVRTCDADGGHHLAGYATTGTMLTDGLRLSPGQGQAMVHTARALHSTFEQTQQALSDGQISVAHAAAITRAASVRTRCGSSRPACWMRRLPPSRTASRSRSPMPTPCATA